MRKSTGFAIVATIIGLAMIFWANAASISADAVRPKRGISYIAVPSSFLPAKAIEPIW